LPFLSPYVTRILSGFSMKIRPEPALDAGERLGRTAKFCKDLAGLAGYPDFIRICPMKIRVSA